MTFDSDVFFLWDAKEPILVGKIFVLDNGSLGSLSLDSRSFRFGF